MRERFAPPVAGGGDSHQARVETVLHIAFKHAIFDQHVALRRIAFIIDIERAAALLNRAVVDHGHAGRSHALADAAAESRTAFAVEIALEAVPDRFVQQDTGPAGAEHDCHRSRRCGTRVKIGKRLRHCLARVILQYRISEVGIVEAPAAAGTALLAVAVLLDDDLHRHAHQGPHVGRGDAVAARDQHDFVFAAEMRHDLRHTRVEAARITFDFFQQRNFGCVLEARQRIARHIKIAAIAALRHLRPAVRALARNRTRRLRRRRQRCQADVIGIGEGRFFARHRAHADALVDAEAAGFDDAFFQAPALAAAVLKVQVGVIDLVRHDLPEHLLQRVVIERIRGKQRCLRGIECGFEFGATGCGFAGHQDVRWKQ